MRAGNLLRLGLGGLVLLAALWAFYPRPGDVEGLEEAEAPVTVGVSRGDVQLTVTAPGVVVGSQEWWVVAGQEGQLQSLLVRVGDAVRAGQQLAKIEGGGPESAAGEEVFLTAPFDGVVLEIVVAPGLFLDAQSPVMRVGDPRAVEIEATVIEEDMPLVAVGQAAEIYFDVSDEMVSGEVSRIVPQRVAGEARPLYTVYLTLEEAPPVVLPGMTADAALIADEFSGVLRLPKGVLRFTGADSAEVQVWQGDEGGIERREIRVGLRGDVYTEIVAGLTEGEEVVGQ